MADLDSLGFVRRERVLDAWLLRVPHAYPVFRVGYRAVLDRLRGHLARWPTLHLAGRTGSFRYMNMDAVIAQALDLVERLVGAE
jgi:UDP-galactopyranose mutase